MKSDFQKFSIKFSRFKGDVSSSIRFRLSFVLTFFVCLLVLTVLAFTFNYEHNQIVPASENITSASILYNMQSVRNIITSYDYQNKENNTNKPSMTKQINSIFNYDILKNVFILDEQKNVKLYSDLPKNAEITTVNKKLVVKYIDLQTGHESILRPAKIKRGNVSVYFCFNPNIDASRELSSLIKRVTLIFIILSLVLTIAITYFVSNLILRPLLRLQNVAAKFAEGDLSDRVNPSSFTEINELIDSYNTMADVLQKLYSTLEAEVSARTKELKAAYSELQSTQAMMVHSEKMKSLGELVAGIMHEINNPINFIYGNMTHLDNYSKDLVQIVDEYSNLDSQLSPDLQEKYKRLKEDLDYDFIKSDIPDLIKSCKEGAERAKNIIQDLKSFSRFEESAIASVNIEKEIDTCLTILYNKYKNNITIHKEFPENMPTVEAYGGQLNQVFMNIIDNAIGAIEKQGDIWIRGLYTNNNVRIEIEDNGSGMSEDVKQKVFNPFFTTKPVGKGTGLGMSITYKVIKNHNGTIEVETQEGIGTKFIITLPLNIDRELLVKEKK